MRRTALVCGNGLTHSLLCHARIGIDLSSPLHWNLTTPGRATKLMDDLPGLKEYLQRVDPERATPDFDIIIPFAARLTGESLAHLPAEENGAYLDLGHYLTLAYSWLQIQMDKAPLGDWCWTRWLSENRDHVFGVLSWNCDLVAERLLQAARLSYGYLGPTFQVKSQAQVPNGHMIGVSKPHGSCNFAPSEMFHIRSASYNGDVGEPMTYPRLIHVAGYDGPMQILPDDQLYSIREVANIVLPGEWNRFQRQLKWVDRTLSVFTRGAAETTDLVIVGFRMAEPDRDEFEHAISWMKRLERIVVVDPDPNPELMQVLSGRAPQIIVCRDRPCLAQQTL